MPESAAHRLEVKIDALTEAIADLRTQHARMFDQQVADRKMTDQLIGFMQQAVDRLSNEILDERKLRHEDMEKEQLERRAEDASIRSQLSRAGYAVFSAMVALTASGLYLLVGHK